MTRMHELSTHDGSLPSFSRLKHPQSRSWSVGPTRSDPAIEPLSRNKSSNALSQMASSQPHPAPPTLDLRNESEESLDLPHHQLNASSSDLSVSPTASTSHPPLSDEVAKLSDKLITAINHQTELEDTLAHVRHELEESRNRVQKLEVEAREEEAKTSNGSLIPRADVESDKARLLADLAIERKQKGVILQEKRGIESELESLTATLFQEANEMVSAANKERDAVERRNQQLRGQVKDTEALLANQQEQLTQLKTVMQQMRNDAGKDEGALSTRGSVGPSSPNSYKENDTQIHRLVDAGNLSSRSMQTPDDVSPAPSTALTHLLKTVCRTDLPAYEEFHHFLTLSQQSRPASRVTSGSYAGLSVMGMTGLTRSSSSSPQVQSNGSTPSVNASANQTATTSPQVPGSGSQTFNANVSPNAEKTTVPLKEMKFYKRLLAEDIEPTLRLDLSPEISWLSKRSIIAAITENGLIAEPLSETSFKLYGRSTPCALCGEARRDEANPRTHRMRVSDDQGATKWALCGLCLEKVRASCELVGYVRMVRDGVVRCADKEEEQETWEELIRLRERLFWARMAGGVVPSFMDRASDRGSPTVDAAREVVSEADAGQILPSKSNEQCDSARPATDVQATSSGILPLDNNTAASAQLHRDLSDSMKTVSDPTVSMPGIRDVTPKTPPRFPTGGPGDKDNNKRGGSWGNLKISVPKAFTSLRDDVNVLH